MPRFLLTYHFISSSSISALSQLAEVGEASQNLERLISLLRASTSESRRVVNSSRTALSQVFLGLAGGLFPVTLKLCAIFHLDWVVIVSPDDVPKPSQGVGVQAFDYIMLNSQSSSQFLMVGGPLSERHTFLSSCAPCSAVAA